jgi:transcriptional regulator with XRE-family HTH domain
MSSSSPPFAAFGDRLRALRAERGLSQQGLADAAGVAYRSIQYLEAGTRAPQHETLDALADALGVPYAELRLVLARPSAAEALTDSELDVLAERLASRLAPALAAELQRLLNLNR